MRIVPATENDVAVWKKFRDCSCGPVSDEITNFDIDRLLNNPNEQCLLAYEGSTPVGFAEMALRNLVDGCKTSPVGYLEAIYVEPVYRGTGLGRELLLAAENWALEKGCTEFATDSALDEVDAQQFHLHMGFEETFRSVQFRKALSR